jgi:hypothetical protein
MPILHITHDNGRVEITKELPTYERELLYTAKNLEKLKI